MKYAWVIDQTTCIGCHACTTACKSENDVPLGSFRTWVKNVEVGRFPDVRRHFAILRCNHCASPPCVYICPTGAMHQRPDGIVDIDHDQCIGCKACMQACPYDAIYMDPVDDTAAKCHFCAHRVDQGLLPACVVVCPTESLIFGDTENPASRASQVLATRNVTVRRPDQGTQPKAYYVGAHPATLDPLAARHETDYIWAERQRGTATDSVVSPAPESSARVVYDVAHPIVWRWKVSAYLWTKSIAAGAAFLGALATLLDVPRSGGIRVGAPVIAMTALLATAVLLIADLKRPARFWFILARPQWRSWLTRGAVVLTAFGVAVGIWLLLLALDREPGAALTVPILVLSVATALYTAFLFAQCEARDLWQNPVSGGLLLWQMAIGGGASLLPLANESAFLHRALLAALAGNLLTVIWTELSARRGSPNARLAVRVMTTGRFWPWFWSGMAGLAVPLFLLVFLPDLASVAALMALAGLFAYEHAFIMAGQAVPVS